MKKIALIFIIVWIDLSTSFQNKNISSQQTANTVNSFYPRGWLTLFEKFFGLMMVRGKRLDTFCSRDVNHIITWSNYLFYVILWKILFVQSFDTNVCSFIWQRELVFRHVERVKTSNEMPNWRRHIKNITRQWSPHIKAFFKGTTSLKSILISEMGFIWSNLNHIACGSHKFYEDLR